MKAMVDLGHSLDLRVGWYANNCGCAEKGFDEREVERQMAGDVHATVFEYGFDSLKLDGCGQKQNLTLWADLFNATGKRVLLENCHWGGHFNAILTPLQRHFNAILTPLQRHFNATSTPLQRHFNATLTPF